MQSHTFHHAIKEEGRARQVAGVLEQGQEEEQDRNLRHKHQHVADASDHAFDEEGFQHRQ